MKTLTAAALALLLTAGNASAQTRTGPGRAPSGSVRTPSVGFGNSPGNAHIPYGGHAGQSLHFLGASGFPFAGQANRPTTGMTGGTMTGVLPVQPYNGVTGISFGAAPVKPYNGVIGINPFGGVPVTPYD
ncbi:MAG: hypothetical protein K2V38_17495, partial [Gemmataceae bacterium]|nr:hypothetical protein [Gemmataceae bacterium]